MKVEEAISLLEQVCKVYRGTLEEHTALQAALKTVRESVRKVLHAPDDTIEANTPTEE
jgi:hypothetical protein